MMARYWRWWPVLFWLGLAVVAFTAVALHLYGGGCASDTTSTTIGVPVICDPDGRVYEWSGDGWQPTGEVAW